MHVPSESLDNYSTSRQNEIVSIGYGSRSGGRDLHHCRHGERGNGRVFIFTKTGGCEGPQLE